MKKKLPFEEAMEQKMQGLQAPGEDEAWRKMKQLLDEEEDRKPFIFFWNSNFWGAVALVAALTFCAIIFIDRNKNQPINKNAATAITGKSDQNKNRSKDTTHAVANLLHTPGKTSTGINKNSDENNTVLEEKNKTFPQKTNNDPLSKAKKNDNNITLHTSMQQNNSLENKNTKALQQQVITKRTAAKQTGQSFSTGKTNNAMKVIDKSSITAKTNTSAEPIDKSPLTNETKRSTQTTSKNSPVNKATRNEQTTGNTSSTITSNTSAQPTNSDSQNANKNITAANPSRFLNNGRPVNTNNNDSSKGLIAIRRTNSPDTSAQSRADSLKTALSNDSLKHNAKTDSAATAKKKKIQDNKKKHYFVAAGIQEQQQIPLSGQQLMTYGLSGKTDLFDDYIPSIYLRLERDRRWFIEGAFSLVAPEAVRPLMYSRHTVIDYSHSTDTATSYQLQKTFYSELPLSFNYYVLPHWSVGAGMQYNWFYGAVTNRTIAESDAQSGASSTTDQIIAIKNYNDSFIYNVKTSLIFQTAYTANRWSFSVRYMTGLQPYITYTLPDGGIINKKNQSLEFLIGYRFFKSKNFKLF